MDNNPKKIELEEGEISDLEDGEIQDDETPENLSKSPLISEPLQQALQGSDFPHFENANTGVFRGGNFNTNPQRPKPSWRRDNGPPSRYIEEEIRFREQENTRMRTRPSFNIHHVKNPRQGILPWKKNMPRISPNLPNPLTLPIHGRPKQQRHRSPLPEVDNTDDFDLLLERHKQIQLQLDRLEMEESEAMLENEDVIDDSFVDIPVSNVNDGDKMTENVEQGDDGENTNEDEQDLKPKSFEPFRIKPLRPPVPTLKELSNRGQTNNLDGNLIDSLGSIQIDSQIKNADVNQESHILSPNGDLMENSQAPAKTMRIKMKRRRRRKRAKEIRRANIANKGINLDSTSKDLGVDVPRNVGQNTVDSRLMQLAATSTMNAAEMEKKMRISAAEKQRKRKERLKWWQQSRKQDSKPETRSGKGRGGNSEKYISPGERIMSDGKDFEKDDYLEAPMDVESDTADGPVLPLIEETGDDAPPPPPPPPAREQELMALMQQQQQMAYNTYSVQNMLNQVHVSPNIHGFYPPGHIIHNDWTGSYASPSRSRDDVAKDVPASSEQEGDLSPSLRNHDDKDQVKPTTAEDEDDDDDEAALLREILLKSVAKKRAAKSTDLNGMKSQSAPASPRPGTSMTDSPKPTASDHKTAIVSHVSQKSIQQSSTIRKIPIQPPQHDPVVIRLGEDSDSSEDEAYKEESTIQQRGGFFGSLDMMLKQARNSVENSKPKPDSRSKETEIMPAVPKTPDALSHLPEERRAEYKRLKEQLAQHEGRKNRQPLSDINQDKESKSESGIPEEKIDSAEESRELLELKGKVKMHEEKLSKHRKSLAEDQKILGKMTSMLSEKTILLEVQETRVAKLKKQLETAQKAMLNNRLVIKKLHEKAIKVKDRVAKKITVTRNIEEDLLRVKSMVSAIRKDPSFYTGSSDSNENKETVSTVQELRTGDAKGGSSLKRSLDDSTIMNTKKVKIEAPTSQSAKASPRKSIIAERIAQEKARLKRLEQDLAERLSHFTKSPSQSQPSETKKLVESDTKQKPTPEKSPAVSKMDENTSKAAKESDQNVVLEVDSSAPMEVTETDRKENKRMEFDIDDKQLDYVKKLQHEKVKKGPTFPKSTQETPQSVHKRTSSCIWLESDNITLPVLDADPTSLDWFGSTTHKPRESEDTEDMEETGVQKTFSVGCYESVLLHFRSYRLSPYFRTKEGLSLNSLTFTHKLNPFKSLCDYELKGACNDEDCKHQHCRDYTPTDTDAIRDLASYALQAPGKTSHAVIEKKINLIVEKFIKQYKGKIPLDQLLVLLVNSIKKDGKKSTQFNIRESARPAILQANQQATDDEESKTVDRGRGVHFQRREGEKRNPSADERKIECQEVRYFSEMYSSIKTMTDAVEETPSDATLWIKLSRLQLHQTNDDDDNSEGQDMGLMHSLNTLSRGLEANPNSEELWLEYLKLFRLQGHPDEHKELCEQAIGFTPTYNIWWHYLDSVNTYEDKKTICIRLLNYLAKQEQQIDELHSHRLLESLLYLVQLELYTGRHKLALLAFQFAIGKKKTNDEGNIPKLSTKISAQDLCAAWLAYIHVSEFHRLPATWFDPKHGYPTRMVAKDMFVFPWQPGGGTRTPSEKILGMFHEALRACTLRHKTTPNKVAVCLPLYQNLLALERAHGRLDSAKGICRRLLQGTPDQVELWQCLVALEEATGNLKQGFVVLKEGLKKCAYDWELAYTTARTHLEQGDASEAIEMLVYTIKSRCMDPSSTDESPQNLADTDSSTVDPILLFRKLLSQPLPYDSRPPPLMGGVEQKLTGRDELYSWLSYCLLLELSPNISPLCLQYNLSAESAYETAVHTLINRNNSQAIWLEYLFYKMSRVSPAAASSKSNFLKPLDDLVNRCMVSVSASRTLPYSTSEYWLDYTFHNQVINLYLGCLPQSLWSAVYTKYLKLYPSNLNLAIRACEHEASTGCVEQAIKISSIFLSEHPSSITMWKILIALNLRRNHTKEAHKLYQQSTDVLPFAATLWKDFIMFALVRNDDKSSVKEIIQKCKEIGVDVEEYLKTLQGYK